MINVGKIWSFPKLGVPLNHPLLKKKIQYKKSINTYKPSNYLGYPDDYGNPPCDLPSLGDMFPHVDHGKGHRSWGLIRS